MPILFHSDYAEKEATFHSQLRSLSSLLPILQLNLVIASAFSGSANKFEFLDLAYVSQTHPICDNFSVSSHLGWPSTCIEV